uniref:Uncharacterized protein n=1 Tax=Agrobacterium albertimagni TaxID=147266 RepID=A0A7C1TA67_9HYPH
MEKRLETQKLISVLFRSVPVSTGILALAVVIAVVVGFTLVGLTFAGNSITATVATTDTPIATASGVVTVGGTAFIRSPIPTAIAAAVTAVAAAGIAIAVGAATGACACASVTIT